LGVLSAPILSFSEYNQKKYGKINQKKTMQQKTSKFNPIAVLSSLCKMRPLRPAFSQSNAAAAHNAIATPIRIGIRLQRPLPV
jgi:hypothetical protein